MLSVITSARTRKLLVVLTIVILSLLIDQLHKYYMIEIVNISQKGRLYVFPFMDLVMVWNKGVSYGLFASDSALETYALLTVTGGMIIFIFLLIYFTSAFFPVICYSFIVGGALGNFVDRFRFGAVADFFSLHAWGYYWYVFNLADVFITIGIGALIFHSFFGKQDAS